MYFNYLEKADPDITAAMKREINRQETKIEMIASENFVNYEVMEAMGSALTNKYAEGYPGKRYYGGCEFVDEVEQMAIDRAKKIFGAEHANVQAHSGANANTAVYQAVLEYGDTVLGMDLSNGGHLTHGSPVNISGKSYHFVAYGLDPETETIDYDNVRELAHKHQPKLIVAGASAYPREIRFDIFRETVSYTHLCNGHRKQDRGWRAAGRRNHDRRLFLFMGRLFSRFEGRAGRASFSCGADGGMDPGGLRNRSRISTVACGDFFDFERPLLWSDR